MAQAPGSHGKEEACVPGALDLEAEAEEMQTQASSRTKAGPYPNSPSEKQEVGGVSTYFLPLLSIKNLDRYA